EHNIPLVGIRAVSDNSDRPLPAADLLLLGCDRETGKTTPGKMAAHLVFRPWRLKDLIPTALTCAHARNEMARELMGFLDQLS
ncbi:MAG: hypothetical protein NTZ01_07015, partial [Verrucomicrobia bacterium]|nr:hypothetical protein [Verrucomicrobiota bacterium]